MSVFDMLNHKLFALELLFANITLIFLSFYNFFSVIFAECVIVLFKEILFGVTILLWSLLNSIKGKTYVFFQISDGTSPIFRFKLRNSLNRGPNFILLLFFFDNLFSLGLKRDFGLICLVLVIVIFTLIV